jgi:hypothetical protein
MATHKFTIDDFTRAIQGKNPEFDAALEKAGTALSPSYMEFIDGLLENTMNAPEPRRRAPKPARRKIRRGVGSY